MFPFLGYADDDTRRQLKVAENEEMVINSAHLRVSYYYWPTQPADDRLHEVLTESILVCHVPRLNHPELIGETQPFGVQ
jgi:hypothetical protein